MPLTRPAGRPFFILTFFVGLMMNFRRGKEVDAARDAGVEHPALELQGEFGLGGHAHR